MTHPRQELEVSFPGTDFELEGVLSLPAREEGTRVPALLLIHGSGPIDRDSTVAQSYPGLTPVEVRTFADLAEGLSAEGVAVLRYDKRSCGPWNGKCDNNYPEPNPSTNVSDFLADAGAALDFLSQQGEIDPERVFALGHSQGAMLVPLLLAERERLSGGLIAAGPHSPIYELLRYQAKFQIDFLVTQLGMTEGAAEAHLGSVLGLADEIEDLEDGDYQGSALTAIEQAFWADWLDTGARSIQALESLDRSLFAFSGSWDIQVPAEELTAWQTSFDASSAQPGHRTKLYECVTHNLNCVTGADLLQLTQEDVTPNVFPEIIEDIAGFIQDGGP